MAEREQPIDFMQRTLIAHLRPKRGATPHDGELNMADKQDSDSDKEIRIIVDGTPHVVPTDEVAFDAVVNLAYPDGARGDLITYTVTYYNGGGRPPEGALAKGEKAKVKDGTVFNVTRTDRS